MDSKFNSKFVEVLKKKYERIFKYGSGNMTVNCGNIPNYLVMTIDYTIKGLYKIMMSNYIKEVLDTFDDIGPKATGTKSSVVPTKLFFVGYYCAKLKTKRVNSYTR